MFRIIKVVVSLCGLVGFVWFGMTVNLGERTLFQHVRAIAQSEESSKLVAGTKETVTGLFDKDSQKDGEKDDGAAVAKKDGLKAPAEKPPVVVRERPSEKAAGKSLSNTAPQESLSAADRQGMRKLIGSRRPESAGETGKK